MQNFLDVIHDIIIGLSVVSVTVGIVIIMRLLGLVKEDHEPENYKLTKKQIKTNLILLAFIIIPLIWAIFIH